MKPWERKLFDWGLLGYLARDVIGAEQEEASASEPQDVPERLAPADHEALRRHRYQPFVPNVVGANGCEARGAQ
jgi:hypothetical protein